MRAKAGVLILVALVGCSAAHKAESPTSTSRVVPVQTQPPPTDAPLHFGDRFPFYMPTTTTQP